MIQTKNLTIAALFVSILILIGCSKSQSRKVGFLVHQQDNRWAMDIKYLNEFYSKEGIELLIKDAKGDENLQIKQAAELISAGVDVILIVAVNQNTAAGIVRMAHENGVVVIGYDRMIKNADLDYLLSFEYGEIGRLLAEYATQRVPSGNYVMFWGDAFDENARLMQESQVEFLKPFIESGKIHLVYKAYIENWKYENALQKMNKIIDCTDQPIDVVIANNDQIAGAVIESLNKNHYQRNVLVTGHDATLEACRLIANGKQAMTIYKPIANLAKEAVTLTNKILNNQKVKVTVKKFNGRTDVPTILLQPVVVDRTNMEATVIKDNLHTYNEIFKAK